MFFSGEPLLLFSCESLLLFSWELLLLFPSKPLLFFSGKPLLLFPCKSLLLFPSEPLLFFSNEPLLRMCARVCVCVFRVYRPYADLGYHRHYPRGPVLFTQAVSKPAFAREIFSDGKRGSPFDPNLLFTGL